MFLHTDIKPNVRALHMKWHVQEQQHRRHMQDAWTTSSGMQYAAKSNFTVHSFLNNI